MKRLAIAACLGALALAASASPASASITIGQLAPGTPTADCSSNHDRAGLSVSSGNGYVVPEVGTITSWSHNATSGGGQQLTMKIFRKVADPAFYEVVAHDGPRPLAAGLLNTFPVSIPVQPGDLLGTNGLSPVAASACIFLAPAASDVYLSRLGGLNDGQGAAFDPVSNARLNVSAELQPSNSFDLGKVKQNKSKGTATLTVSVPNPGQLDLSGKGVKPTSTAIAKGVLAAGDEKLTVKAKGKKKKQLSKSGKTKVKVEVTYTPTGGDAATQTKKVSLKKR